MSALVAYQFQTTFEGSIDAAGLRSLAENPAVRILFGQPLALDDPGGFTVWRTGLPVLLLCSVWVLLAATRITRGEEDAGRADLVLAGRLRVADIVLPAMAAVVMASVLIGIAVGAALAAAGTETTGAVVYAGAIVGVTSTFATAAIFAAQVMPTRSAAVGITVGLLGACLAVRMLADGVAQLAWLAWTTPFGLAALAAPYADNRVAPLLVLTGLAVGLAAAALIAAGRRDVGAGLVAMPTRRSPRTELLKSVEGFAIRRAIRPTVGWVVGIGAYYLLLGALIASILEFFDGNQRFADLASSAGFGGLNSANGFAAALFSLLAIPTGLYAATRLAAMVADERARRWTQLLSCPASRVRLAGTEVAVVTTGVVALHVVAGLAIWVGAMITDAPFTLGAALGGALNSAPIAWLAVGSAALAIGWLPSGVVAIGALPVAGGFLINVVSQSVHAPEWVMTLSPFAHLGAVPNAPPDRAGIAAFMTIGAIAVAVGVAGYSHRDLTT
ncbi:polyketide antibiotic transporter [Mycolicibacterium stellerae]|uniref:polyketide antibiotic transporter n=1 Tax=Mycolicibacterium stellerae TaxID=2358193 RepID=UPI001F299FDB|nr:polyketide antibiotic transporter [Mycolicibacterium stellerae]